MNFFEHQAKAKRQSRWLIVAFLLAALVVILAVDILVLIVMSFAFPATVVVDPLTHAYPAAPALNFLNPEFIRQHANTLLWASLGTGSLVGLSSLYKISRLRSGGGQVARNLGGVLVDADTKDPLRRRLRNVVEEIAIASGVPVPEIYVLEHESAINAFAAGYSESDAAIAVTQGCLEKLSRRELQGVIAHEFSHVFNGDMRINIRLMGVLFGVLVIAIIGRRIISGMRYSRSSRNDNGGAAALMFVGLGLLAIGYIGMFFARWIKSALSRQREYLADASAVQFTRDPESISGALKKIAAYSHGSYLQADSEEVSHMLFGQGAKAFLFATHPPIVDRIRRVEPQFKELELKYLAKKLHEQTIAQVLADEEAVEAKKRQDKLFPGLEGVLNPGNIIDQIGHPQLDGILGAAVLLSDIPSVLREAARSPAWAVEVLFLCVLDADEIIREAQLISVLKTMGADSERQLRYLISEAGAIDASHRFALCEMVFPALKRRPAEDLERIVSTLQVLVEADGEIDVFEYLLSQWVRLHLREAESPSKTRIVGSLTLDKLKADSAFVLGVLLEYGGTDSLEKDKAWKVAAQSLSLADSDRQQLSALWHKELNRRLLLLDQLKASEKERFVAALAQAALSDGIYTPTERELLRIICAMLHTPLPLLQKIPDEN